MAGNRRRKQENTGMRTFLYVVVVLVLLGGMGYLFYYSRSQAKERQEYIKELESKEAATKGWVEITQPEESESESESEIQSQGQSEPESETQSQTQSEFESEVSSEIQTESVAQFQSESGSEALTDDTQTEANVMNVSQTESESQAETEPHILLLNGTGKSGVAAYWKRFLKAKGVDGVVMADYKGTVKDKTVVYVAEGSDSPEGVHALFPDAEYLTGSLKDADPNADTNVKVADGQTEYDSYDIWIVVGKDDALHD